MHTLIYLTGPQGSGKSLLSQCFIKGQEVNLTEATSRNLDHAITQIEKDFNYSCVGVITHQSHAPSPLVDVFLKTYCKKKKIVYHNINLKNQI